MPFVLYGNRAQNNNRPTSVLDRSGDPPLQHVDRVPRGWSERWSQLLYRDARNPAPEFDPQPDIDALHWSRERLDRSAAMLFEREVCHRSAASGILDTL